MNVPVAVLERFQAYLGVYVSFVVTTGYIGTYQSMSRSGSKGRVKPQ